MNSHFYLALLYEKTGKKDLAIEEYQKVLELLPADNKATKDKIQEMVDNLKSGATNIPAQEGQNAENIGQ